MEELVAEPADQVYALSRDAAASGGGNGGQFVEFANALHDESRRLLALADEARGRARELAEQEARIAEREHALERDRADIVRRSQELDDRLERAEAAEARISEAAEREAALRALAHDLLERLGQEPEPASG